MKKYLNWAAWILLSFILTWMVRCAIQDNKSKKPVDPAELLLKLQNQTQQK